MTKRLPPTFKVIHSSDSDLTFGEGWLFADRSTIFLNGSLSDTYRISLSLQSEIVKRVMTETHRPDHILLVIAEQNDTKLKCNSSYLINSTLSTSPPSCVNIRLAVMLNFFPVVDSSSSIECVIETTYGVERTTHNFVILMLYWWNIIKKNKILTFPSTSVPFLNITTLFMIVT